MKKRLLILLSLVAFGFAAMAQDTIRLFTFNDEDAATITLGTLSAGDIVNGETITTDNAHSDGGWGWNRHYDSASFFASSINMYSRSGQWYTANAEYFGGNYLGTDDGFMLMAMMEVTGTYPMNAYIQLPAVNTPEGTQVVAVQLTQLYRKFNHDQCWIDYKVGNDWKSLEINVKGVDVNANSWASFKPYITMPFELAQQPSIELRVRWACNNNAGNAYGYFWMVDNLAIVSAPATNWQRSGNNVYVDGLYGTVPQGWQIPLTWYADVRNIGVNDINGVTANIYSQPLEGGVATSVASTTLATLAGNNLYDTTRMVIDGRQLYDASNSIPTEFYGSIGYANSSATITNNGLTTTTDGWYRAYATISSTVGDLEYGSHSYRVDSTDDMGYNRWSLSRGILSSADVGYRHGRNINYTYLVADEDSRWSTTGYGIMTRLTTPNTIPTDEAGEPWVLRGIELVAAPNLNAEGATLKSMLFKADASGNISAVASATATHVVTADELNNFSSGVKMPGEYNTIRINFPNPVELEPATSYFIGFQKEDDTEFAVARDYNSYYNAAGDLVSFYDDETLVDYADRVPVVVSGVYVFIPGDYGLWAGYNYSEAPMISAVVGPMPDIPTYNISVSHNGGNVIDGISGLGVLSSQPLQYGEGSAVPLYFLSYDNVDNASADDVAEDAMQLKQLIINGEEINLDENYYGDEYTLERYVGDGTNYSYYHMLTFTQLSSDMTVEAVFGPYEAPCLPVANHWVSSVSDTSATIAWEAPEGYMGVYYIVYNGNVIDSVEDVSYTMTGLTSSTTYSGIQIAYRCANGEMKYSSDITFTTNEHQNTFTFTVTKNGNGYLYYYRQSDEENGDMIQSSGTTTLMIGGGDVAIFQTASFDPSRLGEIFGEYDPISMGMMSADALTVQSIYLDGQMIDISNTSYDEYSDELYVTHADNYTLQLFDGMAQYGYNMYIVMVNSDGDHELIFNYGEGETPESYTVSFSSNDPTLGEVRSNEENGTYTEGTQLEAYALPQGGVTFVGWAEGSETNIVSQSNPLQVSVNGDKNIIGVFTTANLVTVEVHDTVYLSSTDTVYLYNTDTVYVPQVVTDTVYVSNTDTVYVYDTVYVGVDGVETDAAVKLYSMDNQIVVEGAQGADVVLYDAVGRRLAVRRDDFGAVRFEVPATGTYLVRVGQYPARRVVVVK